MIMRSNQKTVSKSLKEISCFSSISENDYEESTQLFVDRDIENINKLSLETYKIGKYKEFLFFPPERS